VPLSPIASESERARCAEAIECWADSAGVPVLGPGESQAAITRGSPDLRAPAVISVECDPAVGRWYVRMKGEEKDVVTIWLTIRQRTLFHEAHFMPAPVTNVRETYEYLLRRNANLSAMRFCLGSEDAVFLVGEIPVGEVSEAEIDRIVGVSLEYVDTCFPAAMTVGYAGIYRRRQGTGRSS
jgi:Putative bacterial sensory transduction regulator